MSNIQPIKEFEETAIEYNLLEDAHIECIHKIIESKVFSENFRQLAVKELVARYQL